MAGPSLEDFQKNTEKFESLVKWLVEIWRTKNWVRGFLLLAAILLLVFNSAVLSSILSFFNIATPVWYWKVWVLAMIGLFICALIVAARAQKTSAAEPATPYTAIKGLRPFQYEDAELFSKLERNQILKECLASIVDPDFRFGILCGESGTGKSSFLQAGLLPNLPKESLCVYIKFSDIEPLETIRRAFVKSSKLAIEQINGNSLNKLLVTATKNAAQPAILLFDQFEQFFIHYRTPKQRSFFIKQMKYWFREREPLPVKILVCIRSDFTDRMIELQKEMGYTLGPQDIFRLEKFDMDEAAEVVRVTSESEGVRFDFKFVREVLVEELANRDDGLISPVDIQILFLMILMHKGAERAFDLSAYQKFGGVEGLLERFLKRALDAFDMRDTGVLRQAAIHVLLALVDLETNTRSRTLSLAELEKRLAGTIPAANVNESVNWLERNDVRLITKVEQGESSVYEIAHERLIPALRRIAGKELTKVDLAGQLLNRRVNEWVGNNRATRYLLSWKEYRLIDKNRTLIEWGKHKDQKEELLQRSRRRLRAIIGAICLLSLLPIGIFALWQSPWGQLWQIKRDFQDLSLRTNDSNALKYASFTSAISGDRKQAQRLEERIHKSDMEIMLPDFINFYLSSGQSLDVSPGLGLLSRYYGSFRTGEKYDRKLKAIVDAFLKTSIERKTKEVIDQGYKLAETLQGERDRVYLLCGMAEIYFKLGYHDESTAAMKRALDISRKETGDSGVITLTSIAEAYGLIGEAKLGLECLERAQSLMSPEMDSEELYCHLAIAYAKLKRGRESTLFIEKARRLTDNSRRREYQRANLVRTCCTIAIEANNIDYLVQAKELATTFEGWRSDITDYIVGAYVEIAVRNDNPEILIQARKWAETFDNIENSSDGQYRSYTTMLAVIKIEEGRTRLAVQRKSLEMLSESLTIGENLSDKERSSLAESIARAYVTIAIKQNDPSVLTSLAENPLPQNRLRDSSRFQYIILEACLLFALQNNDRRLLEIAHNQFLPKLDKADTVKAKAILAGPAGRLGFSSDVVDNLLAASEQAEVLKKEDRDYALITIAEEYAKLGYWKHSRDTALKLDEINRLKALSKILIAESERKTGRSFSRTLADTDLSNRF